METAPLIARKMPGLVDAARAANRYLVGVGLLLGVVFLWTASNFITAKLETGEDSWNKPFLITYLNTASFALYLLPTAYKYYNGQLPSQRVRGHTPYHPIQSEETDHPISSSSTTHRPPSLAPSIRRSASLTRPIPSSPRAGIHSLDLPHTSLPTLPDDSNIPLVLNDTTEAREAEEREEEGDKLSIRETAVVAAWWSAVWFIANWAVNASLAWTSVASVTILSSTSGFFTLALGRICGVETMTRTKILAVIASFLGVIFVTQSDSTISTSNEGDLPTHPLLGDMAALLSAAFYAVYVVFLKVRVGDEDRADMQLMLGFAGLFNIIFLIPIFPILHFTGLETFELPPSSQAWSICLINMCITLSSDYLYVLAMLKTTPMLVTIGLSLTIPLALVGSLVLPGVSNAAITLWSLLGAGLVVLGFGMLGKEGWEESVAMREQLGGDVNEYEPVETSRGRGHQRSTSEA